MQALSAMTRAADPYRAGLELGEALCGISPEAVVLTTTIDYGHSTDILDGLRDGTAVENLIIVGNSSDGCYGSEGVGIHGASAIGLNSGGTVTWRTFQSRGVSTDPESATRSVLNQAIADEQPSLVYLVSDFRTDATRIEDVLRDYTQMPIIGGLAADDDRLKESVLYAEGEVITDGVVALAAYGPLSVWTRVANDMTPVGPWGRVDDAEGTVVRAIDGMGSTAFVEHALGKPVLRSDRAVISLRLENPDQPGTYRLRSVVPDFAGPEEHVGLFGGVHTGDYVQVCVPEAGHLLAGIERLANRACDEGIQPAAALMVSCAGRKWFLGQEVQKEVASLNNVFAAHLPIGGFASFGEIAPQSQDGIRYDNRFHNMSLVLTLLGSWQLGS